MRRPLLLIVVVAAAVVATVVLLGGCDLALFCAFLLRVAASLALGAPLLDALQIGGGGAAFADGARCGFVGEVVVDPLLTRTVATLGCGDDRLDIDAPTFAGLRCFRRRALTRCALRRRSGGGIGAWLPGRFADGLRWGDRSFANRTRTGCTLRRRRRQPLRRQHGDWFDIGACVQRLSFCDRGGGGVGDANKRDLATAKVDVGDLDVEGGADADHFGAAFAAQRELVGVEAVVLATERIDAHEAIDEEFGEPHKGPGLRYTGDDGGVDLADPVLHQPAGMQLRDRALEVAGLALTFRTRQRDVFELGSEIVFVGFVDSAGLFALRVFKTLAQQAVHDEVGIATDRRREVQIRRGAEAVVADVVDAVARLLHRTQQQHIEGLARRMFANAMHQGHQRRRRRRIVEHGLRQ